MLLLLTELKELSLLIEDSELTLLMLLLEEMELTDELEDDELLESLLFPSLLP